MPRKGSKQEKVQDMDPKRERRSKAQMTRERNKRRKEEEATMTLHGDAKEFIEAEAKKTGKTPIEVLDSLFEYGFAVVEFDETQGKASLTYDAFKSPIPAIPESDVYSQKFLKEFRRLRDNFAPVAAGVEWHRDFTSGGGFTVQTDDPKDKHKEEMKESIKELCRTVYQDQYTVGLDNIIDILMDMALTDGCAAAEIVYEKEVEFIDYIEKWEEVELSTGKVAQVMVPKEPDWKGELKGITRLKIIEDAATRLRPYRHPRSGEVLYWTLDESGKSEDASKPWGTQERLNRQRKILKFYPWEILWLSWNQRGVNLKGRSIIQAVYSVARFVEAIQKAVGIGFQRWANKKYFFVCGTERRPWSKPHVNQFLKAMEKMIKNNWVGIPVPQGFKVEEMGGEESIFEGKSLLDYLTGMICAGMQYPREFLESGRTRTSEKAWLAWTVRYGRNQQQVRRAIEHQLWKKHLWCQFGQKYRIKKKGVKPSEQEKRDVYVPKLQWRAEGRWHREKKTELFKSLLDAANPIDPPLKMSVQKGIADVLGFGEIDWEVIEEIFNTQGDIRLLEAKLEKMKAKAKLEIAKEDEDEFKAGIKRRQEMAAQPLQPPQQSLTPEQELQRRTEARQEGGVSRTTRGEKAGAPKKGEARPQGGTRTPKRVVEEVVETEKAKRKAIEKQMELMGEKHKKEIEIMETRERETKKREDEEFKLIKETERLTQANLKSDMEVKEIQKGTIPFKGMLPKEVAEQIAKSFGETEVIKREKLTLEKELLSKHEEEAKAKKTKQEKQRGEERKARMELIKVREEKITEGTVKTEELKQKKLQMEMDRMEKVANEEAERKKAEKAQEEIKIEETAKEAEIIKAEEEKTKTREDEEAKLRMETEKLKQKEIVTRTKKEEAELDRIKKMRVDITLLPQDRADEITKEIMETQRLQQEKIKVDTQKAKVEFERQKKKIKLLDELEERMKKKKKRVKK